MEWTPADAIEGLRRGDFSRLEPLFVSEAGAPARIVEWHRAGRLDDAPDAVAEALSCACFLGHTDVATYFLDRGIDPSAGDATGLNAFHWAANRGQLEAVRLLIRRRAPLETRNSYDGTVLGIAVWSAIHEPKPDHLPVIEELLAAGANVSEAEYPTGREDLDEVLKRYLRSASELTSDTSEPAPPDLRPCDRRSRCAS